MPLRAIEIAGYRAVEEGRVTFEDTTFLFGENDSGRSTLIEALQLTLGSRDRCLQDELRPHHFGRRETGAMGPLHVRIEVEEGAAGAWELPARMAAVYPDVGFPRVLLFDFWASLDDSGSMTVRRGIQSRDRHATNIEGDDESEAWLRAAFPLLWLGPGVLTDVPEADLTPTAVDTSTHALASDPDVRALVTHHRNVINGTTSDVAAEIESGAAAARALVKKYPRVFSGAAPLISAMATEVLDSPLPESGPVSAATPSPANPAGKIALLLLATQMIDLATDALRSGPLPTYAQPVMILENPEANLHPITIASLWRIVERVTWQKVVATNSDIVLSYAPVTAMRRLTRQGAKLVAWSVAPHILSRNALRKIDYHLRSRRAAAIFARCWVLVEGETEFWVLPEMARILGYDLAAEGVSCVEFAQSGPQPLLKVAAQFGIGCHVLTDGDHAGLGYSTVTAKYMPGSPPASVALTTLDEPDIEHCFWNHGFDDVIARVANIAMDEEIRSTTGVIHHAIDRTSKPYLALALVEATARRGPSSVPPPLRSAIESAVRIARANAGLNLLTAQAPL